MYSNDKRIVITLDAGGTNFVFGAMRGYNYITEPLTLPSNSHDLDLCLATMIKGFEQVIESLDEKPVAISFAFPGPADYANGIIGGWLPNFPSFRNGVALGPMLTARFGIPVYINNDGDLYAYGEAIGGILPEINAALEARGSSRRYRNLLGYTFGTGFGMGSVINGELNTGNNSCTETFCLRHKHQPDTIVEEGVAVRAIKRIYGEKSGDKDHKFEPYDIYRIAEGILPGDRDAARDAFAQLGEVAGDAMATAVTLTDSLVVIGGGITGARRYFMPALLDELRSKIHTLGGEEVGRVQMQVYDLDDPDEFDQFAEGTPRKLQVYGTDSTVDYDPVKRTGVAISRLGASKAISIGAYAFALNKIDNQDK